jgi:hypothetical protein
LVTSSKSISSHSDTLIVWERTIDANSPYYNEYSFFARKIGNLVKSFSLLDEEFKNTDLYSLTFSANVYGLHTSSFIYGTDSQGFYHRSYSASQLQEISDFPELVIGLASNVNKSSSELVEQSGLKMTFLEAFEILSRCGILEQLQNARLGVLGSNKTLSYFVKYQPIVITFTIRSVLLIS